MQPDMPSPVPDLRSCPPMNDETNPLEDPSIQQATFLFQAAFTTPPSSPDHPMYIQNLLDFRDHRKFSIFHRVVARGYIDIAQQLIATRADVHDDNNARLWTPLLTMLHCAETSSSVAVCALIEILSLAKADINQTHRIYRNSALAVAVRECDIAVIHTLLTKSADINAQNFFTRTPLFDADNVEITKVLVQAKAEIQHRGMCNKTALHSAVHRLDHLSVTYLIEQRADVNVPPRGLGGWTLFEELAVFFPIGRVTKGRSAYPIHLEILKTLLEAKADPMIRSSHGHQNILMQIVPESHATFDRRENSDEYLQALMWAMLLSAAPRLYQQINPQQRSTVQNAIGQLQKYFHDDSIQFYFLFNSIFNERYLASILFQFYTNIPEYVWNCRGESKASIPSLKF